MNDDRLKCEAYPSDPYQCVVDGPGQQTYTARYYSRLYLGNNNFGNRGPIYAHVCPSGAPLMVGMNASSNQFYCCGTNGGPPVYGPFRDAYTSDGYMHVCPTYGDFVYGGWDSIMTGYYGGDNELICLQF